MRRRYWPAGRPENCRSICFSGRRYKGIALAAATAMVLAEMGVDVPFSYNRKEAKDHGEGELLVGAPLAGRM